MPSFYDVQGLSCGQIAAALKDCGISSDWQLATDVILSPASLPFGSLNQDRAGRPKSAFQNLVVGTIAEHAFREQHLAALEKDGFGVVDYHEQGENRDFAIEHGQLELPVNVKVASTIFRKAWETVKLQPQDCIPISAYKAIGASERVPDLVYVVLVDFELREKVDAYMDALQGSPGILWDLLSWYGGRGAKRAQDEFVTRLFDSPHGAALLKLIPGATHFRAVSAQRVLAVMRSMPRRCPGLGVKAAGTGTFNAEVNIHLSVAAETVPWDEVGELLRRDGIQMLLDRIRRTEDATIPAPLL